MESNLSNKVINGLFWKISERISAQLVTFVVSIILARLLSPSDYGLITMVTIFITIANVFVVSGFGNALIQKKDIDNIDYSTVFYFNIGFSVFLYFVMFLIAPYIASFYKMPILTIVLRVLSVKIILAGINSVQQAYVSRNMLFKRFFWSTFLGTIVSAFVGIYMAYSGFGVWALVAQYLTNSAIDTLVLWCTVKWRPEFVFNIERLIPLIRFGWKVLLDQLLSSIYDNLKSIVIGKVYTSTDLAYYSKGVQFPNLLVTNINSSIGSVLFPALSKLQDCKQEMVKGLKRSIRLSSFFLTPALLGLFAVAPSFITILLTDKWLSCVPYLRIACVYFMFFPITTANLQALLAIGRSDIVLRLTLVKRIFGILLIFVTLRYGVWMIAFSDLLVVLLSVFLNTYYNSKLLGYKTKEQIVDVLPSYVCSVLMCIVVWLIGKIEIQGLITTLVIQIILGALVYLILSLLINRDDFKYCIDKVKLLKRGRRI